MDKTNELIKILLEHPNLELVFMYAEESSDYAYTLGYPSKILIDEYVSIKERVWLRNDNADELFDEIADEIASDYYEDNQEILSKEKQKEIEHYTKERINKLDWKKAIIVYIDPK